MLDFASALRTALGQEPPNLAVRDMSAFPPIATELRTSLVVRFGPRGDIPHFRVVPQF
jgi:hypothetical protein